jgi:hypothetical protein
MLGNFQLKALCVNCILLTSLQIHVQISQDSPAKSVNWRRACSCVPSPYVAQDMAAADKERVRLLQARWAAAHPEAAAQFMARRGKSGPKPTGLAARHAHPPEQQASKVQDTSSVPAAAASAGWQISPAGVSAGIDMPGNHTQHGVARQVFAW